jgi:magnesium transporter
MHFPSWKHTHSEEKNQEIDFIIGKDTLITARYDTVDALHRFAKNLEVDEILDKKSDHHRKHNHFIFVNMLRNLYMSVFEELEHIEDMAEDITVKIFKEQEKEMVVAISEMTRTLLNFKRVTDTHHEILESLHRRGKEIFGENFSYAIESIIEDYIKVNMTIKSNLELLHELRDTNNSLLTTKQNETVKQLTAMGFVILPLNLIAWIFAMRTEGMPLIENPNAFWIVIGIMITSVIITTTYAKHKRWM